MIGNYWRGVLLRAAGSMLVLLLGAFALILTAVLLAGISSLGPRALLVAELDDGQRVAGLLLAQDADGIELLTAMEATRPQWQRLPRERIRQLDRPAGACIASNGEGLLRVQAECAPPEGLWRVDYPNAAGWHDAARRWLRSVSDFVLAPARADGQGGIGAALVGTFLLVLLMTLLVLPVGVLVGLYLAEQDAGGRAARWLRRVLAQLAAIPSVVYGVVGLGLFVHQFGHRLDQWLHPERLPSPTWASGGLLWAALVLALLTLPTVVVVVEQGLRRLPGGLREASLALGATRSETVLGVLIPAAAPALLTALILAVARASTEVAPLLLVGAVRYAAQLPVSSEPPFLHLERPFMHLGFRVLDLATSAAGHSHAMQQAMACAMVLLVLVLALNGGAILARARLRERYARLEG